MNDPCTSCGEILAPDDDRCPYCGTLAPPRPGATVFAHEQAEPRWAGEPTAETLRGDPAVAVADPLAIPIREPSPVRRAAGDPGPRLPGPGGVPRAVVGALVAVALLVVMAVVAMLVSGGGDGDDLASDDGPVTTAPAGADDEAAATTGSTSPSTTSTTTTTTTTTSTTTTTTAPAAPAGPGSVPVLPRSFRGGWVAQLSSVPASAGTSSVETAYARIRGEVPGAVAARSDEWPSMTPGYWVFVDTGFDSEDAVRRFCATVGRSGDACLPRQLAGRR